MEDKVQGVVLQSVRYGDTSLVVKVYTRHAGLQSYMVKGVNGKNLRNKAAFFQPLTMLRFVQSGNPNRAGLGYLRDVELDYAYRSIPGSIEKSAVFIYLAELLAHTLVQQERNESLFQFVRQSLQWLDLVEGGYANFPIFFTLELSRHLGFYPQANYCQGSVFDMTEGQFVMQTPPHPYCLDETQSAQLSCFLGLGLEDLSKVTLTGLQRSELLDRIITFMRLHAPVLKGLQSHEVLNEILR